MLFLYAGLRLRNHLLLHVGLPAMGQSQAFNPVDSFVTNTTRQSYSGESA
jgi:K+-transporting ATPase A subunit